MHDPSSQLLSLRAQLALLLAVFAISVGYSVVLPILPFAIEQTGEATGPVALSRHTGAVTAAYILAVLLFAPLWGRRSDRWGRRPVLLVSLFGFVISSAAMGAGESLVSLYLARFSDGLFAAAIAPAAYALIADHSAAPEWRASRFALINGAGTLGFFVGPLLGGLVIGQVGDPVDYGAWRSLVALGLMTSVLGLAAFVAVWRLVPEGRNGTLDIARAEDGGGRRPLMRRLWVIALVSSAAVGAFEVGVSLRGKYVLAMNAYEIGLMFAECSLVMLAAQVIVFSPVIKAQSTRRLITPALMLLGLGLAGVPFANSPFTIFLTIALVAASAGVLSPIVTYWVSLSASNARGADLGSATAAASLGQLLGSVASGFLFGASLVPDAAFTVTAALVLLTLVASFGLAQRLQSIGFGAGASPSQTLLSHQSA